MFLVLGIDAATWKVIRPNLSDLRNFGKLVDRCKSGTIHLKEKLRSASLWCGMFSGKYYKEHGHGKFVKDKKIVKREDIKVDFIWDLLHPQYDVRVLNVPFVVPTYSFNVNFKPIAYGLPIKPKEWSKELEKVTGKTIDIMLENPNLLISVFTLLDRVQHFHWGENVVLKWYKKMDEKIGKILFETGYLAKDKNKLILVSDHGFCSFEEAKVQTLPKETEYGELKGDHDREAIVITKNVKQRIKEPQDVFKVIKSFFK